MRRQNRLSRQSNREEGEKAVGRALIVDYDEEADVLYVFLGRPYPTANYTLTHELTLRSDPQTGEVVGLTIIDCRPVYPEFLRFARDPKRRRPFFLALLRALNAVWQFHRQEAERAAALAAVPAHAASG